LQQNKDIFFKGQIQPSEAKGLAGIHTGGVDRTARPYCAPLPSPYQGKPFS
jgi:hypothetical protein